MGKRLKLTISLFLILFVLCASGCFRLKREAEFKWNGTIDCAFDFGITEKAMLLSGVSKDELLNDMSKNIGTVMPLTSYKEIARDGETYYGSRGKSTLPSNMADVAIGALIGTEADTRVTRNGFLNKTIYIQIKLKSVPVQDDMLKAVQTVGRYGIEDEFSIKVPYKITSTNGMIDSNDDRRVSWDLYDFDTGKETSKVLTLSYFDWTPVFIILGVVVISTTVVLIVVNAVKRSRRRMNYDTSQLDLYETDAFYRNVRPNSHTAQQYRTNRFLPIEDYRPAPQEPRQRTLSQEEWNNEYQRTEYVYHTVEKPDEFVSYNPPVVNVDSRASIAVDDAVAAAKAEAEAEMPDSANDIISKYGSGGSFYKK